MRKKYSILFFTFASILISKDIQAQQGTLDTTFHSTGKLVLASSQSNEYANAIAVQADSGMIITGFSETTTTNGNDIIVGRILSDGTMDSLFGTNGWVVYDHAGFSDYAYDVDLQTDGKIVVSGAVSSTSVNKEFFVMRLNTNGTFDTTFASTGKKVFQISTGDDFVSEAVIQIDGKIVLGGYSNSPTNSSSSATFVRLNVDGSLDSTFGTGGISQPDNSTQFERVNDFVLKPNGSFIAVGYSGTTFYLAESWGILSDGTVDSSYGVNGRKIINGMNFANAIGEFNNQYYICGTTASVTQSGIIVAINDIGNDISSFGNAGTTSITMNLGVTYSDLEIQSDGKVVTVGRTKLAQSTPAPDIIISRFNLSGIPDVSFGTNGHAVIDLANNSNDNSFSIDIQSEDKIVACGVATQASNDDMCIVRLNATSIPVSVNDFNYLNETVSVFPNPAVDHFFVQLPQGSSLSKVELITVNGTTIVLKKTGSNEIQLPENLMNGLYILRIFAADGIHYFKLIR